MDLNNVTITVSKTRELIPINNELVNFQAKFSVVSEGNAPFRALILSQSVLDSDAPIEMKSAPRGIFSGTITEASGNKDDWYLALEADTETKVQVHVKTDEIEQYQPEAEGAGSGAAPPAKKGFPIWLLLLIGLVVLVAGFLVYKHFFAPKCEDGVCPLPKVALTPLAATLAPTLPVASPITPTVEAPLRMDFSDLPAI
jgi:hypothetical protein